MQTPKLGKKHGIIEVQVDLTKGKTRNAGASQRGSIASVKQKP